MSSIGSNQSSKRWELLSIAECESSGLLVTFFMAWSPGRCFNAGDSRLITTETTPPSIPTNQRRDPAGLSEVCKSRQAVAATRKIRALARQLSPVQEPHCPEIRQSARYGERRVWI